jgi:LmbE family N-acetylglucosaminyl deacetylase
MDSVDLLDVVKIVEKEVKKINPKIVYTHHIGDLNIDHTITHKAVVTACRPEPNKSVRKILCFEIPSSTEWQTATKKNSFNPNYFIDISKVKKIKIKAFQQYRDEIKSFPHPRSEEAIINRSKYWGSSVGIKNAEAFFILRDIVRN